jgi:hypothetical protein
VVTIRAALGAVLDEEPSAVLGWVVHGADVGDGSFDPEVGAVLAAGVVDDVAASQWRH